MNNALLTPAARSARMTGLVFLSFFVLALVSNIFGAIVPDIITGFHLSMGAAALLPFCFYAAYGVMSVPSGFAVERWGEKRVVVACYGAMFAGCLSFALFPAYRVAVGSLFLIGASAAALQVVINPLLRTSGGEGRFAFNSTLAQFIFGVGSFLSPMLYAVVAEGPAPGSAGSTVRAAIARLAPASLSWAALYWLFAGAALVMLVIMSSSAFPRVVRTEEESAGALPMYSCLFRKPVVLLYFVSVFLYVGSEQGTATWISEFLARYHRCDPHTSGALAVSQFWALFTGGCFAGMFLLRFLDSRTVLRVFAVGALAALTAALFGPAAVSRAAFPAVGLCASVMWPVTISLALNSLAGYHGPLSGILCSGIMGGAVVPLVIGRAADFAGLRAGMCLLYLTFGWVLGVSFWAHPLVVNETVQRRDREPAADRATPGAE